ncbi:MAG: 4-hydroxybutyrate CoA-transferase [Deltaproteobacteria bacterium]|nr:4-hydroxybutyrate CoA-transferase [Deltaproteobacteria bacterium]
MKKGVWSGAREALRRTITPGSRIFFSMASAQPQILLQALAEDHSNYQNVEVLNVYPLADHPLAKPGLESSFRCVSLQNASAIVPDWKKGRIDFIPVRYSHIPWIFSPRGPAPIDVALIQVAPPDRQGRFSLGASASLTYPLACGAKQIVAEVNDQTPRTCGPCSFSADEIDFLVEASHPLFPFPEVRITAVEKRIGEIVASLVPDHATIEIGVGNLPGAILQQLEGKRDIGIHSGMLSDPMINLVDKGVITNRKKNLFPGKLVAGELFGSEKLFRFAHENESVEIHPARVTHNPRLLGRLQNFVAINSTVEIDLSGQMNGEFLGENQIGSVGGLFDFVEGAFFSGGKSITALTATAGSGRISRIVSNFPKGTPVTLPRYMADAVVTEFGIAELKGKTLRQRAKALIAIAHPDFRDRLMEESGGKGEKEK